MKRIIPMFLIMMLLIALSPFGFFEVKTAQAAQLYLNQSLNGLYGPIATTTDVTLSWSIGGSNYASGTQIVVRVKDPTGTLVTSHLGPCSGASSTNTILGAAVVFSTSSTATGTAFFTFGADSSTGPASSSLCVKLPSLPTRGNYTITYAGGANINDYGVAMYYVGTTQGSAGNAVTVSGQIDPILTMNLSSYTCQLGSLNPSGLNTCSYNLLYTSNITSGAVTTLVYADNLLTSGGNTIANIADHGTVTAGIPGHGIVATTSSATTSISANYTGGDNPIMVGLGSARTLLSINNPVQGATTTITHKAAIDASTPLGTYSQIVYFITTTNF